MLRRPDGEQQQGKAGVIGTRAIEGMYANGDAPSVWLTQPPIQVLPAFSRTRVSRVTTTINGGGSPSNSVVSPGRQARVHRVDQDALAITGSRPWRTVSGRAFEIGWPRRPTTRARSSRRRCRTLYRTRWRRPMRGGTIEPNRGARRLSDAEATRCFSTGRSLPARGWAPTAPQRFRTCGYTGPSKIAGGRACSCDRSPGRPASCGYRRSRNRFPVWRSIESATASR